jgi:glycosyltransferase involved in cell wall biosynthesis
MKILLSAYSCLPTDGSEPAIGWNWAHCIAARGHDVVVITRAVNRQRIEGHRQGSPADAVQFVYYDLPRAFEALYSLPLGNYAYYTLWQYAAAKLACSLHRSERFDCVQHITWGTLRGPSWMGRLGIPFIFGPVGGGEDTPRRLRRGLGWRGRLWDALRRAPRRPIALWMESTYESATEIVTTTQETLEAIPAKHRHKAWSRQAVGIDAQFTRPGANCPTARQGSRLELLFVGRLLPWKGLHLVFKALARLDANRSSIHFTVIGTGSDLARLRWLSGRLKLDDMVTWRGWMERNALLDVYREFDLFMLPSLHDSGGMAVLEAMRFGLPVVCLDLGGPATAVNNQCGRVIATGDRDEEEIVRDIAEFLAGLLADRSSLSKLSDAARARAATLTFQANVDAVYQHPPVSQARAFEGVICAED